MRTITSLSSRAQVFACLTIACGTATPAERPPAPDLGAAPELPASIIPEPPAEGEPTDLEHHAGALYAVDGSTIRRGDIASSSGAIPTPRVIVDVTGSLLVARVAVSDAGLAFIGQVVENGQATRRGRIMVAAHDGSGLREIWSGPGDQYDVGLHADEVVWTSMDLDPRLGVLDESSGTLMRAPFAGGAATVAARIDHPRQLVIVGDAAWVGARGAVVRVPLGPTGPSQSFPITRPIGALAVDASDIVLSDLTTGEILIVPRAGGPERSIAPPGSCVRDLELDGAHVYIACGALYRVARTGGPLARLSSGQPAPSLNAVALDARQVWGYSALEHRFESARPSP